MIVIIYNLVVISIFAVLSYKMGSPLISLFPILFIVTSTTYSDYNGEE